MKRVVALEADLGEDSSNFLVETESLPLNEVIVEDVGAVGEEIVPFGAMVSSKEREEVDGNPERSEGDPIRRVVERDEREIVFWSTKSLVLMGETSATEAGDVGNLVV